MPETTWCAAQTRLQVCQLHPTNVVKLGSRSGRRSKLTWVREVKHQGTWVAEILKILLKRWLGYTIYCMSLVVHLHMARVWEREELRRIWRRVVFTDLNAISTPANAALPSRGKRKVQRILLRLLWGRACCRHLSLPGG